MGSMVAHEQMFRDVSRNYPMIIFPGALLSMLLCVLNVEIVFQV